MSQSAAQSILKSIHETFQDALKNQPAYGQILPFFETLFEIQEAAVAQSHPQIPHVKKGRVQLTKEQKMPLLDRQKLTIDQPAAMRLLKIICGIAQMANAKLTDAANVISDAAIKEEELIPYGLRQYLANDEIALHRLSRKLEIEKDVLAFFFHHSIWPSLAKMQRAMALQHPLNGHWKKGICPVCGCLPYISFLSESGQRFLACGFCRHQWTVDRIFCPSCHNSNPETTGYFYCDQEQAYRVNTCDQCHRYIKTVDTRQLQRFFYPPLENVVTSHLDIRAEASGYQKLGVMGMH